MRPPDRMHGEASQGPRGGIGLGRALEKLLYTDDRETQLSPLKPRQQRDRRTRSTGARLAFERNQEGRIEQERWSVIHG